MKNNLLHLLRWIFIFTFTSATSNISFLDFSQEGAVCVPIYYSGKSAFISLLIENIVVEDETLIENIRIPFAFFKYTDITYYDNFPIFDVYHGAYRESTGSRAELYQNLVDFNTNKFLTKRNDLGLENILGKPNIYTKYLTHRDNIQNSPFEYEIKKSGIYCIYIAPPLDKGIMELSIPIRQINSYDGISIQEYKSFCWMKYSFAIGLVLLSCLTCYLLKFKKYANDGGPYDSYSLSSNLLVYNLAPLMCIQAINILQESLRIQNSNDSTYFYLNFFKSYIRPCAEASINYYSWLLFSMGLGIIYSFDELQSQKCKLPETLKRKANFHLIFNILIIILSKKVGILNIFKLFLPILWSYHSSSYYLQTKVAIAKFPAFRQKRISKVINQKYRNSILLIYLVPFVWWICRIIFQGIFYLALVFYFNFLFQLKFENRNEKVVSIAHFRVEEAYLFKLISIHEIYASEYIIVIFIFYIWMKL